MTVGSEAELPQCGLASSEPWLSFRVSLSLMTGKLSTGNGITLVTELPKRLAPVVSIHGPTVVCRELGDRQKTGIQDGCLQSCVLSPLTAAAVGRGEGKMWEKQKARGGLWGTHKVWVRIMKSDTAF